MSYIRSLKLKTLGYCDTLVKHEYVFSFSFFPFSFFFLGFISQLIAWYAYARERVIGLCPRGTRESFQKMGGILKGIRRVGEFKY